LIPKKYHEVVKDVAKPNYPNRVLSFTTIFHTFLLHLVWVHEVPSSSDFTNQSKISTGLKTTVDNFHQMEPQNSDKFQDDSIINDGDLQANGTSCSSSIDSSFSGSSTTPDLMDSKKSSTAKSCISSKRTWVKAIAW
jgi:hypothetical protein